MAPSLSFDRAAGYYDRTRELPEEVAEQGVQAILAEAGPDARILDVGTGTGRISVPLLRLGINLMGCDISRKMMELQRQKFAGARLAEADASLLPFPAGQFDAVTTCHVMHLVAPWREALREYHRVLRGGGAYIDIETDATDEDSLGHKIMAFWKRRVAAYGASTRRPGAENEKERHAALIEIGATLKHVEIGPYRRTRRVGDVIDVIANRTQSSAWVVPDDIFMRTVDELREWAAKEFKDPSQEFEEESRFTLDVARFGDPAGQVA